MESQLYTERKKLFNANNYDCMTKTLDSIQREHVTLHKAEKRRNTRTLLFTLNVLLEKMKEIDENFAAMRPHLVFMGSYFEGLKIHKPIEYDINLVLTLPMSKQKRKKINLDASRNLPQYTSVILPERIPIISPDSVMLSAKGFREWMQGVLDKTLHSLKNADQMSWIKGIQATLTQSSSGPAYTLSVVVANSDEPISIDLVPTLYMHSRQTPSNSTVDFNKARKLFPLHPRWVPYYLIPKPTDNDNNWRIVFPLHEKRLLKGTCNLKNVMRLIKQLRDIQRMDGLVSYHIKTVFLWELLYNGVEFFRDNSKANLLMYMLRSIRDHLKSGKIVSYWCPNSNVLMSKSVLIDKGKLEQWANRLTNIIDDIDEHGCRNPREIIKYFVK